MVRNISEECRTYLQSELLKEKDIAALMIEDQKITEERGSIQDNLTRFRKGLEAIDKIETSFGRGKMGNGVLSKALGPDFY